MSYSVTDSITNTLKYSISINSENNVIIGHNSYDPLTKKYKNCNIIGNYVSCTGNSQIQLGNTLSNLYSASGLQHTSDLRDKAQIRNTELGLNFISLLRPVDFKWNYRNDYIIPIDEYHLVNGILQQKTIALENNGLKTRNRFHHGLIAQEVKQIMNDLNIDFGGYQDHSINGGEDQLTISYTELIAPMVKAIQELKTEIDTLKQRIITLENKP